MALTLQAVQRKFSQMTVGAKITQSIVVLTVQRVQRYFLEEE